MPERLILTPKLVDQAEPPQRGERWIADLKLRGFGLRLWRSPNGEPKKAYVVRAKHINGRTVRKTAPFDENFSNWYRDNRIQFRLRGEYREPTFGELLPYAREWASERLREFRGLPTIAEEEAQQEEYRAVKRSQIANLSLAEIVDLELRRMAVRNTDQAYIDRANKLFYRYVEENYRTKNITKITADDIQEFLSNSEITESNFNVLRPLIGRAFKLAQFYGRIDTLQQWDISDLQRAAQGAEAAPDIGEWSPSDLDDFQRLILQLDAPWQSRLLINVSLSMRRVPLSRLLAARWDQVELLTYKQGEKETVDSVELRWAEGWHGFERIPKECGPWFEEALQRRAPTSPATDYIWPSDHPRSVAHIRTVAPAWRKALKAGGLSGISLAQFRTHLNARPPYLGNLWSKDRWWRPEVE